MHPVRQRSIHGPFILAIFILCYQQQGRDPSDGTAGTNILGQFIASGGRNLPRQKTNAPIALVVKRETPGSVCLPISQRYRDPEKPRKVSFLLKYLSIHLKRDVSIV